MPERRTWNRHEVIPRVVHTISVDQYDQDAIEQELLRLRTQAASTESGPLVAAANAWAGARGKLERVQDIVRRVGERLAGVWTGEASQDSQYALMLIHDSAGDLADTAHRMSDFTGTSADLLRTMLASAPAPDDPGPAERFAGDVGAAYGRYSPLQLLPGTDAQGLSSIGRTMYETPGRMLDGIAGALGLGEDRTEEYRAALDTLNQQYVAESWRMPAAISATLPQIDPHLDKESVGDREPQDGPADDPTGTGTGPGAPGQSGGSSPPLTTEVSLPPGTETPIRDPGPSGAARYGGGPDGPGSTVADDGFRGGLGGGLAGAGGGLPSGGAGSGVGAMGGAGSPVAAGSGGGGVPGGAGVGGIAPAAGNVRPGGMVPTGGGGARGTGARAGGGTGAPGTGAAPGAGGRTGGRPSIAGGMMPAGGAGGGTQEQRRRETWLIEDDNPFHASDEEDLPPGFVK